ncbi:MAG: acyltransferase [Labilithrix sp.]|nr:acyltransferase [Labilithrix sp.]
MRSHGTGLFSPGDLARLGTGVVFEDGVLIFHPENVEIGDDVYVGHRAILKGYFKNRMIIGRGTWIGQMCFFHSAGGITIGENVGIGPCVKILTSSHQLDDVSKPILHAPVDFAPVTIGDGADLGVGSIILPGVTIGKGAQIGAGAVVTASVPDFAIASGVPAKVMRHRNAP